MNNCEPAEERDPQQPQPTIDAKFTAVGYFRCSTPRRRGIKNNLEYTEPRKRLRQFAKKHKYVLWTPFFDPLGQPEELPFPKRAQLARLADAVENSSQIKTVLVDKRTSLAEDNLVLALLCGYFRSRNVKVVETEAGVDLTADPFLAEALEAAGKDKDTQAREQMQQWEALIRSLKKRLPPGRKRFGADPKRPEENEALTRLRSLNKPFAESKWKIRDGVLETRRSYNEIVRIMNKKKYCTRTGAPWCYNTVLNILGASRRRISRQRAIEDGLLKDVSAEARDAEIPYQVAITRKAWGIYIADSNERTMEARLSEVLAALRDSMKDRRAKDIVWRFTVASIDGSGKKGTVFRCIRAPGDTSEPVITVVMPDERQPLLIGGPESPDRARYRKLPRSPRRDSDVTEVCSEPDS